LEDPLLGEVTLKLHKMDIDKAEDKLSASMVSGIAARVWLDMTRIKAVSFMKSGE
jgi:hypothetical protein